VTCKSSEADFFRGGAKILYSVTHFFRVVAQFESTHDLSFLRALPEWGLGDIDGLALPAEPPSYGVKEVIHFAKLQETRDNGEGTHGDADGDAQ